MPRTPRSLLPEKTREKDRERNRIARRTPAGREKERARRRRRRKRLLLQKRGWTEADYSVWKATPDIREKWRRYRVGALRRDYVFELTLPQFASFWRVPCTYCGKAIPHIGLDRVDNALGYTEGNVVSCCFRCNKMKLAGSLAEFIAHCRRVVDVADAACVDISALL